MRLNLREQALNPTLACCIQSLWRSQQHQYFFIPLDVTLTKLPVIEFVFNRLNEKLRTDERVNNLGHDFLLTELLHQLLHLHLLDSVHETYSSINERNRNFPVLLEETQEGKPVFGVGYFFANVDAVS